jgi:AGCS family alanine or glycine:cation symporter
MLGPFIDTILGCTLTALVILSVFPEGIPEMSGIALSIAAFAIPLGEWGKHLLGVSVLLFAYATILGMANYNQKCWDYLFRGRWGLGAGSYQVWYAGTVFVGAILAAQNVLNLVDIAYALMVIPNIVMTVAMAPRVKRALADYDRRAPR